MIQLRLDESKRYFLAVLPGPKFQQIEIKNKLYSTTTAECGAKMMVDVWIDYVKFPMIDISEYKYRKRAYLCLFTRLYAG